MKRFTATAASEIRARKGATAPRFMDVIFLQDQNDVHSLIPLQRKRNLFFKRSVDILFSSILLLLVFSWLLPVIAILIRMDSRGPVFFLQQRHKKNGKVFTCIKFRTMVVNEEADTCPSFRDDHRITRFGRFLRNNYLDELPQLLNVLLGDMSLIGPRPYMVSENEKYARTIADYHFRHLVKPGMTGLAQSTGHFGFLANSAEMRQRLSLDEAYIRNWTFMMDLRIMWRTVKLMIS